MSLFGGGAGGWVLRHFKWSKEKAEEEERQRRRRKKGNGGGGGGSILFLHLNGPSEVSGE